MNPENLDWSIKCRLDNQSAHSEKKKKVLLCCVFLQLFFPPELCSNRMNPEEEIKHCALGAGGCCRHLKGIVHPGSGDIFLIHVALLAFHRQRIAPNTVDTIQDVPRVQSITNSDFNTIFLAYIVRSRLAASETETESCKLFQTLQKGVSAVSRPCLACGLSLSPARRLQ